MACNPAETLSYSGHPTMIFRLPRLAILLYLPALLAFTTLSAQDASPRVAPPPPLEDRALTKISGIFDTDLPKTERKGSIRFTLHPHLGDFHRRSYLRLPFGIRWGVNDRTELSATVEPYLEHGLKRGSPGYGVGSVMFGGKYAFLKWLKPKYDISAGLNIRLPVGTPPLDLTDGFNHYSPYVVVSKKSPHTKGLTYFVSGGADLMDRSSVAGVFRQNDPHSSSLLLGAGFVLDRYPFHYTLEAGYRTTSLIGDDNQQFFFAKPGFAWDLPRRLTFNSKGRWLLGFSLRFTQGPDGLRIDSGGKIRGEFSLRRWFNDRKAAKEKK